jgi:hypothetical protein
MAYACLLRGTDFVSEIGAPIRQNLLPPVNIRMMAPGGELEYNVRGKLQGRGLVFSTFSLVEVKVSV